MILWLNVGKKNLTKDLASPKLYRLSEIPQKNSSMFPYNLLIFHFSQNINIRYWEKFVYPFPKDC